MTGEGGVKHDAGKDRWDLFPKGTLSKVSKVLGYGAEKYAPNNWKKVQPLRERYYAATMRHLDAWWQGELVDLESGLPHLAHAACCILFLMWHEDPQGTSSPFSDVARGPARHVESG